MLTESCREKIAEPGRLIYFDFEWGANLDAFSENATRRLDFAGNHDQGK